jgi:hypothetical protein
MRFSKLLMTALIEKTAMENKPWHSLYQEYINSFSLDTKIEKKWAYKFAKKHYQIHHSKGLKKNFYQASNWIIATALAGQLADGPAEKLEKVTHIPKKKAQDWNVAWSCIDHIAIIYGGVKSLQAQNLPDIVSTAGEKSLYVSVPVATVCTLWALYRLANRDDKARPSWGYGSAVTHAIYYAKTSKTWLEPILNHYQLESKKENLPLIHTIIKDNLTYSFKEIKQTVKNILCLEDKL